MLQFKYIQLFVVFRKSFYLLALVSFPAAALIWLSGCKRCKDIPIYTQDNFFETYPEFMGFEGHETLTFLKNGNDTVSFKGQGLQAYNETERFFNGCEADYILLHHKVVFKNKTEGDLVFHYFKESRGSEDMYEILFKNQTLIRPTNATAITMSLIEPPFRVLGREYEFVKRFTLNRKDSLYLNGSDDPRYRVIRINLNDVIYEVIP